MDVNMALLNCWGRLCVLEAGPLSEEAVYQISKQRTIIGRDPKSDIRLRHKEVSREHILLEVDTDLGTVTLSSIGREPVIVNGLPVRDPVELSSGDQIEIKLLRELKKVYIFETEGDETLVLPHLDAQPISVTISPRSSARKRGRLTGADQSHTPADKKARGAAPPPRPPPPPPPPPPRRQQDRLGKLIAKATPIAKEKASAAKSHQEGRLDPEELQNALKAGLAGLKKTARGRKSSSKPRTPAGVKKAAFAPQSEELVKLRSRLRKTSDEAKGEPVAQSAEVVVESAAISNAGSGTAAYCDFLGIPRTPTAAPSPVSEGPQPLFASAIGTSQAHTVIGPTTEESSLEVFELPDDGAAGMLDTDLQPMDETDISAVLPHLKKRKTVRFSLPLNVMGTPEGAARDATDTIDFAAMQQDFENEPVVFVDADNTAAISAWAMGTLTPSSPAAMPAVQAGTTQERRSSSRLSRASFAEVPALQTIAEGTLCETPEPVQVPFCRSASQRQSTPAAARPSQEAMNASTPSTAAQSAAAAAAMSEAAGSTPAVVRAAGRLRRASASVVATAVTTAPKGFQSRSARRASRAVGSGVRFNLPAALTSGAVTPRDNSPPTPVTTPVAGFEHTPAAGPAASALAMALEQLVASPLATDLTVELPEDFFASPQGNLELVADPVMALSPASRTPLLQHATFRAVTKSPQVAADDETVPTGPVRTDPGGLSLTVPLSALPSPLPPSYTLHIPKEAINIAGQSGSVADGARQLAIAVATALGASPSGMAAAEALQSRETQMAEKTSTAVIAARLATAKVQKLSAAVAAAERRASKATKKAATLGKLLTREHSLRVAAEAAHEQALAHLTAPPAGDHDTAEKRSEHVASGAARAQTPTTAAARKLSSSRVLLTAVSPSQSNTMPFVRQMEAAVQEASPATGAGRMSGDSRAMARLQSLCLSPQVAQERARPSPTAMKARGSLVALNRQAARAQCALGGTPHLPRWPFVSPKAAVANDVTGTEYDDGDTLCEQEVQDMARDIQESPEAIIEALGPVDVTSDPVEEATAQQPHHQALQAASPQQSSPILVNMARRVPKRVSAAADAAARIQEAGEPPVTPDDVTSSKENEAATLHGVDAASGPACEQGARDASRDILSELDLDAAMAGAASSLVQTATVTAVDIGEGGAGKAAHPGEVAMVDVPRPEDDDDSVDPELCRVCHSTAGKKVLLLCDGCDAPTHLACTQPRLRRVPRGDWFCPLCIVAAEKKTSQAALDGPTSESVSVKWRQPLAAVPEETALELTIVTHVDTEDVPTKTPGMAGKAHASRAAAVKKPAPGRGKSMGGAAAEEVPKRTRTSVKSDSVQVGVKPAPEKKAPRNASKPAGKPAPEADATSISAVVTSTASKVAPRAASTRANAAGPQKAAVSETAGKIAQMAQGSRTRKSLMPLCENTIAPPTARTTRKSSAAAAPAEKPAARQCTRARH